MPDHLCHQWRTVLCARNPRNRVALLDDSDDPFTLPLNYLGTLRDMVNAGLMERVTEFSPLHVYQLRDTVVQQIQHGKPRFRANNQGRADNYNPITVEHALTAREVVTEHLKLRYEHAPNLVTALKTFTMIITQRLTAVQMTELIALIHPITMTFRWYGGIVLRPAVQEYHMTFWTHD